MIRFRCWYCNRAYLVADSRIGERLVCSCTWRIRVPKVDDGNSRYRSALDFFVEWVVYGGGGGLLGFLAGFALSVFGPGDPSYDGSAALGFLGLVGAGLGLLAGGLVAVLLDRRA